EASPKSALTKNPCHRRRRRRRPTPLHNGFLCKGPRQARSRYEGARPHWLARWRDPGPGRVHGRLVAVHHP
ncbi:hypothetical protein EXIGLDRAFT_181846, partial [Exidia glandulosa HHB12029]